MNRVLIVILVCIVSFGSYLGYQYGTGRFFTKKSSIGISIVLSEFKITVAKCTLNYREPHGGVNPHFTLDTNYTYPIKLYYNISVNLSIYDKNNNTIYQFSTVIKYETPKLYNTTEFGLVKTLNYFKIVDDDSWFGEANMYKLSVTLNVTDSNAIVIGEDFKTYTEII